MIKRICGSSTNRRINGSILAAAGLGETAYFLKKAQHYLSYADAALLNIDFEGMELAFLKANLSIEDFKKKLDDVQKNIDSIESTLVSEVVEREGLTEESKDAERRI